MSENFRNYIKKELYPVHPSQIKFKTNFRNCIYDALKQRDWKETEDNDWDIYFAEKENVYEVFDHGHLQQNQKINHFRNYYELCRKDNLIKNLKRHKRALDKEGKTEEAASYNFFPQTFKLPSDYSLFFEEFKKTNSGNPNTLWIMKPIAKSQGKGIFLLNKMSQISNWKNNYKYNPDNPQAEPYIVQKYINNPLTIGGKKFDLRIYALVTSYNPLTIYLYRTGFARFTHHRYNADDISNHYVHLTNVAVQKNSENYDKKRGGKWELNTLKHFMISKYGVEKVSEAFSNIQKIIVKSLQAVQKVILNDKHCYELYGYDILFDSDLKPWLLEVNGSPSMTANTPHDAELKVGLLDDVFTIIDLEKILTGQEEQVGGFDLIFKGTPIKLPSNSQYQTLLGAQNNRKSQLKKLAKSTVTRLSTQPIRSPSPNSQDHKTRDSRGSRLSKPSIVKPEKPVKRNSIQKKPRVNSSALAEKVVKNVANGLKRREDEEEKKDNREEE